MIDAALKEIKQSQKVLQIGATFGDQIEQTADRIGHYGKYDLIDISETQLTRAEEKYKYLYSNMRFLRHDGREPLTEKYDVVLVYMLLHELPILSKIQVVEKLWDREIYTLADKKNSFFWRKKTYFGDMYQKAVASRKDDRNFFGGDETE